MRVAFYGRPIREAWKPKVAQIFDFLQREGVDYLCHSDMQIAGAPSFGAGTPLPHPTQVLVTLGGDGTFLEAVQWALPAGIPLTGINFGRLGFLAGGREDRLDAWLQDLVQSRYRTVAHTLLEVQWNGAQEEVFPFALNDVVVGRQGPEMLELELCVDGQLLCTYRGDGLIVATPTGSTAYNLSVGGPIVFPSSGVFVVSPIAPHNLNVRPIVLPQDAVLHLRARSRHYGVALNIDNRTYSLRGEDTIKVKKARRQLTCLEFPGADFITTLRAKLLWGFDKRNEDHA